MPANISTDAQDAARCCDHAKEIVACFVPMVQCPVRQYNQAVRTLRGHNSLKNLAPKNGCTLGARLGQA
jgi:hypothetical protein